MSLLMIVRGLHCWKTTNDPLEAEEGGIEWQ